jgi:hypothetical protein
VIATQLVELSARIDALAAQRTLLDAVAGLETAVQAPLAAPYFDGDAATHVLTPEQSKGTAR